MAKTADPQVQLSEETTVYLRRFAEARRYGFCKADAHRWAEAHTDSGDLRRLKRDGCSARLAVKILL